MKLDCESTLSLNDLKGAYVYKTVKEGKEEKEVQYRIYDFSIEFAPCFDNPDNEWEMTGYELDEVSVTLIPLIDGKWNKEQRTGMTLRNLKDYTIQLAKGFSQDWE